MKNNIKEQCFICKKEIAYIEIEADEVYKMYIYVGSSFIHKYHHGVEKEYDRQLKIIRYGDEK